MKKRIIAMLLTLAMLLSVLPAAVLAAEDGVCLVENAATAAITDGIALEAEEDAAEKSYVKFIGIDESITSLQFTDEAFEALAEDEEGYLELEDEIGGEYWEFDEGSITAPI